MLPRQARSPRAPVVRVLEPRAGTRVGQGRTVIVRWTATDRRRSAPGEVDFSTDRGRGWQVIATGATLGRVVLPTRFLRLEEARIRVWCLTASTRRRLCRALRCRAEAHRTHPQPSSTTAAARRCDALPCTARPTTTVGRSCAGSGSLVRRRATSRRRRTDQRQRASPRDAHPQTESGRWPWRRRERVRPPAAQSTRPHLLLLKAPDFVKTGARSVALRLATTVPRRCSVGRRFRSVRRPRRSRSG